MPNTTGTKTSAHVVRAPPPANREELVEKKMGGDAEAEEEFDPHNIDNILRMKARAPVLVPYRMLGTMVLPGPGERQSGSNRGAIPSFWSTARSELGISTEASAATAGGDGTADSPRFVPLPETPSSRTPVTPPVPPPSVPPPPSSESDFCEEVPPPSPSTPKATRERVSSGVRLPPPPQMPHGLLEDVNRRKNMPVDADLRHVNIPPPPMADDIGISYQQQPPTPQSGTSRVPPPHVPPPPAAESEFSEVLPPGAPSPRFRGNRVSVALPPPPKLPADLQADITRRKNKPVETGLHHINIPSPPASGTENVPCSPRGIRVSIALPPPPKLPADLQADITRRKNKPAETGLRQVNIPPPPTCGANLPIPPTLPTSATSMPPTPPAPATSMLPPPPPLLTSHSSEKQYLRVDDAHPPQLYSMQTPPHFALQSLSHEQTGMQKLNLDAGYGYLRPPPVPIALPSGDNMPDEFTPSDDFSFGGTDFASPATDADFEIPDTDADADAVVPVMPPPLPTPLVRSLQNSEAAASAPTAVHDRKMPPELMADINERKYKPISAGLRLSSRKLARPPPPAPFQPVAPARESVDSGSDMPPERTADIDERKDKPSSTGSRLSSQKLARPPPPAPFQPVAPALDNGSEGTSGNRVLPSALMADINTRRDKPQSPSSRRPPSRRVSQLAPPPPFTPIPTPKAQKDSYTMLLADIRARRQSAAVGHDADAAKATAANESKDAVTLAPPPPFKPIATPKAQKDSYAMLLADIRARRQSAAVGHDADAAKATAAHGRKDAATTPKSAGTPLSSVKDGDVANGRRALPTKLAKDIEERKDKSLSTGAGQKAAASPRKLFKPHVFGRPTGGLNLRREIRGASKPQEKRAFTDDSASEPSQHTLEDTNNNTLQSPSATKSPALLSPVRDKPASARRSRSRDRGRPKGSTRRHRRGRSKDTGSKDTGGSREIPEELLTDIEARRDRAVTDGLSKTAAAPSGFIPVAMRRFLGMGTVSPKKSEGRAPSPQPIPKKSTRGRKEVSKSAEKKDPRAKPKLGDVFDEYRGMTPEAAPASSVSTPSADSSSERRHERRHSTRKTPRNRSPRKTPRNRSPKKGATQGMTSL